MLRRGPAGLVTEALAHLLALRNAPLPHLLLCYHRVVQDVGSCYDPYQEVTLRSLDQQLALLAERWTLVPLSEWLRRRTSSSGPPLAALTFDDAHRTALAAASLLRRRGVRPALFVPTATLQGSTLWFDRVARSVALYGTNPAFQRAAPGLPVARGPRAVVIELARRPPEEVEALLEGPWAEYDLTTDPSHPSQTYCSPDELRGLAQSGWEIGAHSHTHPWLPACTPERLADELARSRRLLRDLLGRAPEVVAYPGGGHSPAVRRAAAAAGYTWGLTVEGGTGVSDPFAIDRRAISEATSTGARRAFCRKRFLVELRGDLSRLRARLGR